jgi:hypothetical protein
MFKIVDAVVVVEAKTLLMRGSGELVDCVGQYHPSMIMGHYISILKYNDSVLD